MESRAQGGSDLPKVTGLNQAQLETALMNAGSWSQSSVTTGLPASHVHQNKNQERKSAAGQDSHLPSEAQRVHADNLLHRLEARRVGQSLLQTASAETRRINR